MYLMALGKEKEIIKNCPDFEDPELKRLTNPNSYFKNVNFPVVLKVFRNKKNVRPALKASSAKI
jgi:hypothetical protein